MGFLDGIEKWLEIIFLVCYAYQVFYLIYILAGRKREKKSVSSVQHRIGVVISARNEEKVIGNLIKSIKRQNYPKELVKIYVVADNCTDRTAEIARENGAIVFERYNEQFVGKGYALDFLLNKIFSGSDDSEAYVILDADNLLDINYLKEMNDTFNLGYNVITSYRNSKNYASNWISAGYSLWFLREAKYLNNARMELNTSCTISGTGFMVKRELLEKNGGWKYFLLTEDIEFSAANIINGEKIGYAGKAVLYDEQPVTFKQSWNQRLRWAKGFYQVLGKYGLSLVKNLFTKFSFSCFDILMTIFPAIFVTVFSLVAVVAKVFFAVFIAASKELLAESFIAFFWLIMFSYVFLYIIGLITTITEWKSINCSSLKKILYTFTFPLFMFTYVPIAIVAIFKKVEWTPIEHTINISDTDLQDNRN